MKSIIINGIKCYAPKSNKDIISLAFANKAILIAINAEKILHSNQELKNIINKNIGYPDGHGAILALKKKGIYNVVKIPGCELWLNFINHCISDTKYYFVGGKEEIIQQTVLKLKLEYPSIQIVGFRNGYINSDNEKDALIQDIINKRPDVVFVGMGSPKQELLMEEMHRYHSAVYQGLGGSFDIYTGSVKRAPECWIKNNLEWAYRLLKQPTRIKRQIHLFTFYIKLILGKL
jgi:UDP-N-acetyl-D-mannosaminouronate:lipid I N-acetyl-D-mannosaminouronosyltransferase